MNRSARHASAGFTLIELMVVLAIIGVMAAAVAPSLGSVMADRRQGKASIELVDLSRLARAMTRSARLAHLLVFEDTPSGLGRFRLWVGMNKGCLQTPWAFAFANHVPPLNPVVTLNLASGDFNPSAGNAQASDVGRQVIRMSAFEVQPALVNRATMLICYQPNGETYYGNSVTTPVLVRQTFPLLFTFTRFTNPGPVAYGTPREVIFPVDGSARAR